MMNGRIKKIIKLGLPIFLIWALGSCSNIMDPGTTNEESNAAGNVTIYIDSGEGESADSAQTLVSRTFVPESSTVLYSFKFTKSDAGAQEAKIVEFPFESITGNEKNDITLETGKWKVEVTRYETIGEKNYPVATGTGTPNPFTVTADNVTPATVRVELEALSEATGLFTYKIKSAVAPVNAKLTLRPKQLPGDAPADEYGITETIESADGELNGTIENIRPGSYDVFVSLITPDGKKGTGKYSSAIIYQGLETSVAPDYFTFEEDHFVSKVYLAGHLVTNKVNLLTGSNITITAYNSADRSPAGDPYTFIWTGPLDEWIMPIEPGIPSVYFDIEVTENDLINSEKINSGAVNGIPVNGRDNINLSLNIYEITPAIVPPDVTPTPEWTSGLKRYASPGQKISFNVYASTYGFRPGSLKFKESLKSDGIPVTGSFPAYFFIMPEGDVTLSADFYTAKLTGLTVEPSAGVTWSPLFDPAAAGGIYTVTVPNHVTEIAVSGTPTEYDAVVTGFESYSGLSTTATKNPPIDVTVQPPDEAVGVISQTEAANTYTLNVIRAKSANNLLKSLTVSHGTLPFTPDPEKTEYSVVVDTSVENITIKAAAADTTAKVTLQQPVLVDPNGDSLDTIQSLSHGDNPFKIQVTAENTVTKDYIITVTRKRPNTLANLSLSAGSPAKELTLTPAFSSDILYYTASVPVTVTDITVTTSKTHDQPSVIVTTEGNNNLQIDSNTITVTVDPGDEVSGTKTYTIYVNRGPHRNLTSLSVTGYTLAPEFSGEVTSYTVGNVPYSVSGITIEAGEPINGSVSGTGYHTLGVGENTINVIATDQDGNEKVYTITVNRSAPSTDNTLSGITLSAGQSTLVQDQDTQYSATVGYSVDEITVNATPTDSKARVFGNGLHGLRVGVNTILLNVIPESGTPVGTYTLKITRQSNDTTLSSLTVSEGNLDPAFNAGTLSYNVTVGNAVDSIEIDADALHENATVEGIGDKSLNVGDNQFTVKVIAEDSAYSSEPYTINVHRQSNDATLSGLTVSEGNLEPNFNADAETQIYDVTVPNTTTTIVIAATKNHSAATVVVNGPQTLAVDDVNQFTVVVTAEDSTYTETYTINVHRQSNDATLSSLTVSQGTLIPAFSPEITSYDVSVPNDTTAIDIAATKNHAAATAEGTGTIPFDGDDKQFTVKVTAEDSGYTNTYTINVHRQSNDATLESLTVNGTLVPDFNADAETQIYDVTVPNTTTTIVINATKKHNAATVEGIGEKTLNEGSNPFEITVTAEDTQYSETYTVTVTRAEPPADPTDPPSP